MPDLGSFGLSLLERSCYLPDAPSGGAADGGYLWFCAAAHGICLVLGKTKTEDASGADLAFFPFFADGCFFQI